MIPGSNLLKTALSVIVSQTVAYYGYQSRALNDVGQEVSTFAAPISLKGSFQPVPRQLYHQFGLDLQKNYFTLYASTDILDLSRGVSGDQIIFDSKRYQVESSIDWFNIDGWKGVVCCQINEPGDSTTFFGFSASDAPSDNVNFNNGGFHE